MGRSATPPLFRGCGPARASDPSRTSAVRGGHGLRWGVHGVGMLGRVAGWAAAAASTKGYGDRERDVELTFPRPIALLHDELDLLNEAAHLAELLRRQPSDFVVQEEVASCIGLQEKFSCDRRVSDGAVGSAQERPRCLGEDSGLDGPIGVADIKRKVIGGDIDELFMVSASLAVAGVDDEASLLKQLNVPVEAVGRTVEQGGQFGNGARSGKAKGLGDLRAGGRNEYSPLPGGRNGKDGRSGHGGEDDRTG